MSKLWNPEDAVRLLAKATDLAADAILSLRIWREIAGARTYRSVDAPAGAAVKMRRVRRAG